MKGPDEAQRTASCIPLRLSKTMGLSQWRARKALGAMKDDAS
jgi:hypothetical protein